MNEIKLVEVLIQNKKIAQYHTTNATSEMSLTSANTKYLTNISFKGKKIDVASNSVNRQFKKETTLDIV